MGKPKIKRKSTLIDMTAMSDVTVLLLTFFMLTSTFLAKEPATVITPSSVSEEKVPMEDLVTVLVTGSQDSRVNKLTDPSQGKVFIGITGETDSVFSGENIRRDWIKEAARLYNKNKQENEQVGFSNEQIEKFTKLTMFGLPMADLPAFLDKETAEQDNFYKYNPGDPAAYQGVGIPISMNRDTENLNEFQIWMQALQNIAQRYKNEGITNTNGEVSAPNDKLFDALKRSGRAIALKGDKDTPYSVMDVVLDNLKTIKLNKLTFVTALTSVDE
ncbi:MAG: hypothetical protein E7082_06490 [Bacteroidales bacterium]|nr:hypothetical protein [Bacteroidales bacterium]